MSARELLDRWDGYSELGSAQMLHSAVLRYLLEREAEREATPPTRKSSRLCNESQPGDRAGEVQPDPSCMHSLVKPTCVHCGIRVDLTEKRTTP